MDRSGFVERDAVPAGERVGAASTAPEDVGRESPDSAALPVNAMSVDVEEHFQVSAFIGAIDRSDWASIPSRLARNMDRILRLFADHDTKATFFTLGWVAERNPEIVRRIVAEGHELASHGYDHARVWSQQPQEFFEDVARTKKILEDLSGQPVAGYRAPSFSITDETPWAHEMLAEAGYLYSSSIYPISHDHYGMPEAPRFPYRPSPDGILEVPMTTTRFAGRNWPGAGGGYFRLLPSVYSTSVVDRVHRRDGQPAIFYFHPWEVDAEQPRVSGIDLRSRVRHYSRLASFERRLAGFLRRYRWSRMDYVFRDSLTP